MLGQSEHLRKLTKVKILLNAKCVAQSKQGNVLRTGFKVLKLRVGELDFETDFDVFARVMCYCRVPYAATSRLHAHGVDGNLSLVREGRGKRADRGRRASKMDVLPTALGPATTLRLPSGVQSILLRARKFWIVTRSIRM